MNCDGLDLLPGGIEQVILTESSLEDTVGADVTVFLASDAAATVSGAVVPAYGG